MMKKPLLLLTATLLPCAAFAGEEVYRPVGPAPVDYAQSPVYQWFVGGSVGYLVDAEDEFYSLHLGRRLGNMGAWGQSIFLEVGFSELENDGSEINLSELGINPGDSFTGAANIEATFVPITLNYMLERQLSGALGFYAGVGAGFALIDVDGHLSDDLNQINDSGNDSETSFFAQAFLGLNYAVSDRFTLFGGARYMFIDDYAVTTSSGRLEVDDADDFLIELGGRVNF